MSEILTEVYRNKTVESVHYGSVAVTDANGELLWFAGDPEMITFSRSSAKPFQFMPVFESGAIKRFGHSLKQCAIMMGSHNGSAEHVEVAKSNLELIKLDESYLKCGTHLPIERRIKNVGPREGEKFRPLQHNCSGKHSGQLALSVHIGDDPLKYIDPDSKTQQLVKRTVSEMYDYPIDEIQMGTDGCSLPNFALPLKNMARGFAAIVAKNTTSDIRREAFETIIAAMTTHPEMVSGEGRSDLAIARVCNGDVICKVGGEAVEGIGVLPQKIGIAIKMADGQSRGLGPVICEVLRQLKVIDEEQVKALAEFSRPQLYNNREINIGEVVPVVKLKKA